MILLAAQHVAITFVDFHSAQRWHSWLWSLFCDAAQYPSPMAAKTSLRSPKHHKRSMPRLCKLVWFDKLNALLHWLQAFAAHVPRTPKAVQ